MFFNRVDRFRLLVVSPHSQDLHHAFARQHLVDKSMLNVDPSRAGAVEITHQLLEGRRALERVTGKQLEELLDLRSEWRPRGLARVLLRRRSEHNPPRGIYQPGFVAHLPTDVWRPLRMESRIPGIDSRYRLS